MELLPLVCLCLLSCSGDAVRVIVEEDSDAVLNCSLSTEDLSGKAFDWRKDGQKEVFLYDASVHSNTGLPGQDDQFKGRVSHFQDQLQNGDASIKITRTKMADSGNYSCDFPRHQPRQTFIIELVVDQVLKDRTGENIPGLAPEPVIKILDVTKDGVLLQCEARGVPPLTVEMKDGAGNILNSESTPKSETGSPSSIALNITVTKTDNYSCVATQETLSHQVAAVTSVYIPAVRVVVEEGSDAVLPCLIRTKEDITGKLFDWKKDGQKQVFTHDTSDNYPNRGQDEQFKDRVSVFQDQLQNGNASIKITITKMADSGIYSCDFPRHQPRQTSIIELVVARVRVVVKEDSDAVLPCLIRNKENITGNAFDWKKDGQDVFFRNPIGHTTHGRDFTDRVSFFEDQLQNGDASIKITRTKMADSGNYSCIFPNVQPSQTSIIELVVDPVLKDRRCEKTGAASKPSVKTIKTDKAVMLQCEVLGASPKPKVEWKDSSGNILQAEKPQVTESGGRYDIVLRAAVTKTDTFRCVVTQEEINHQIYDEIHAVHGAASEPYVRTIQTDDGMVLQCKVVGASPKPKVEWKDSSGNILQAEEPQVTERGGGYDIILRAAVTKTDTFRCVVTQEEISHQIYAETDAAVSVPPPEPGSNTGLIVAVVVLCLLLVAAVVYHFKDRIRQICALGSRRNTANGPTGAELSANPMIDHSERL